MVTDDMLTTLQTRSAQRRKDSEDFKKLAEKINKYCEQKARKSVPLAESEFFAARADFDAEKEEAAELEEPQQGAEPLEVVKRDYYFNEVLSVTKDYLAELRRSNIAQTN
jgi:carboxyl-terminal processing protease